MVEGALAKNNHLIPARKDPRKVAEMIPFITMPCLFCEMASKAKSAKIIFEDHQAIAFNDIAPKAPTHILIIPKKHLGSVEDIESSDEPLVGHLIYIAKELARQRGINESGYRLVFNTKKHAGQIIEHLHLHLLGGTMLGSLA